MIEPGLYPGEVMHRRMTAPPHRFAYRTFWIAVDLDAPPKLRLFSLDRANLFSVNARDHADGTAGPLRAKIAAKAEGIDVSGRMILLTMPRLFGFVFNPLSVYFCHDAAGVFSALAWEVSNTFGARHTYVIAAAPRDGIVRQTCDKRLHVSPFLDMGMSYQFRVEARGDKLTLGIVDRGRDGPALAAALTATRRPMTDAALIGLALRAPFATLKIVAAIHWEALRLLLKGAKFHKTPPGAGPAIAAHASSVHALEAANLSPIKAVNEAAE
jgi:DUF1365 family protein